MVYGALRNRVDLMLVCYALGFTVTIFFAYFFRFQPLLLKVINRSFGYHESAIFKKSLALSSVLAMRGHHSSKPQRNAAN